MNKSITYLIVGVIVVIIALFGLNRFLSDGVVDDPNQGDDQSEEIVLEPTNVLIVPNQAVVDEVYVEKISIKDDAEGGFVAVYRVKEDGSTGDLIGVSDYIENGETDNFVVSLNDGEMLAVNDVVRVMLHGDDGDKEWNMEVDTVLTNEDGNDVIAVFTVLDEEAIPGFETKL